jgi:hypothetical protein
MPRIADRIARLGFKPTTRDKKKRQTEFRHEMAAAIDAFESFATNPFTTNPFTTNPFIADTSFDITEFEEEPND